MSQTATMAPSLPRALRILPILEWLPEYSWTEYGLKAPSTQQFLPGDGALNLPGRTSPAASPWAAFWWLSHWLMRTFARCTRVPCTTPPRSLYFSLFFYMRPVCSSNRCEINMGCISKCSSVLNSVNMCQHVSTMLSQIVHSDSGLPRVAPSILLASL